MVVRDGSIINQLSYQPIRQLHAERFVGRKNMLSSFEDAIDKGIGLTVKKDTIIPDVDQVTFRVFDFNDSLKHAGKKYQVDIEAYPSDQPSESGTSVIALNVNPVELELGFNLQAFYPNAPAFILRNTSPPKK